MIYTRAIPVEFNHCDPAGIVFYPRYFEMTNSVVENFFRDAVGRSFAEMVGAGEGVPTARVETDFHAPSRLGEMLDWTLTVPRVGTASLSLHLMASCVGQKRLTARLVLVSVAEGGRPRPWTAAVRARLEAYLETADA